MLIGYNIRVKGIREEGVNIKGETFEECYNKLKNYYEYDYDVDTSIVLKAEPIEIDFTIE